MMTVRDLKRLEPAERAAWLKALTPAESVCLLHTWRFWARPEQLAPSGSWFAWVYNGGRGTGKTRAGAEWVRERVDSGLGAHVALVGKTPDEVRDVMIHSPIKAGLMDVWPPHKRPKYEPSKKQVTFWNGAIAHAYSSERPDKLRGPQHATAWVDEFAKFQHPEQVLDNLIMGLRVGADPRLMVTTTPRPLPVFVALIKKPSTVVTRGTTFDNRANLSPQFLDEVLGRYEGTRVGRQEIYGEVLEDVEGAIVKPAMFRWVDVPPLFDRVVVGLDPAVSAQPGSDETGIICVGRCGNDVYVLADASGRYSPDTWASKALALAHRHQATNIVVEANQGGDMAVNTIKVVAQQTGIFPRIQKIHAMGSKGSRAEPIAALYEQGRIFHVGRFPELEDQWTTWVPGEKRAKSPDRVDAMVHAVVALQVKRPFPRAVEPEGIPYPAKLQPRVIAPAELYWPSAEGRR